MHGAFNSRGIVVAADPSEGWEPYIPSFMSWREVVRQLGRKPTLYVMRKRDGFKWKYRACSITESSRIEARDA